MSQRPQYTADYSYRSIVSFFVVEQLSSFFLPSIDPSHLSGV